MKRYNLLVILLLIILSMKGSLGQTDSTFWFGVPYATPLHVSETGGVIRLTTLDRDAEVTITRPSSGSLIYQGVIPAGETESVVLPTSYVQNNLTNRFWDRPDSSSIFIRSKSPTGDMPPEIKAYYEIARVRDADSTVYSNSNNNPDIFSLKGSNALGTEFYTPFQTRWNNRDYSDPKGAYSSFIVVATEDNTTITVNSPFEMARWQPPQGNYPANTNITITLDRGESYKLTPRRESLSSDVISVAAGDRLRGTHITSDKPISVTIADDSGKKDGPYDFIGDQLVPVQNMAGDQVVGHEYVVMRGQVQDDTGGERLFILATQDNTTIDVDIDGGGTTTVGPLMAGQQEFVRIPPSADYAYVNADQPVYVLHVSGFGDELGGAILPTIDGCTGSLDVSFVRSKRGANGDDFYLNLMTKKEGINNFHVVTNDGATTYDLNGSDFRQVLGTDWYILDQPDDNLFDDSEITPHTVTRVYNDSSVFHLGMINGRQSGGGCMYGYFSDYIDAIAEAVIVSSGSQITSGCFGDTIQLRASGGISYQWQPADYLDDPTIAEPKAIGLPPGIYKYDAIINNPCFGVDTLTVLIEIYENVDALFELSSGIGCAPFDVGVVNKTTGANDYHWDWEDDRNFDFNTDSDSTFVHTYRNHSSSDSVYTMRLVALNDSTICSDEYERQVRVHPEIHAGFTQDVDLGCNPLQVHFTDTSSGNTYSGGYEWDLGDGSSSSSDTTVNNLYINNRNVDTTYNVSLVTTSPELCRDTAWKDITVRSYLEANFTVNTVKGCSPLEVDITHNSKGDVDTAFWHFTGTSGLSFRDTSYARDEDPDLVYLHDTATTEIDTVNIQLLVSNGHCYDTARRTVYVYPEVTADYTPGDLSGCNPQLVDFANQSHFTGMTTTDTTGLVYDWDFGDEGTSHLYNPDHLFDNINPSDTTYQVQLMVTSPHGCQDSASSQITVSPYIKADFKVEETNGCSPFEVQFENTSEGGIDSTYWDFDEDDNTDSTLTDSYFTKTFYNDGTMPDTVRLRQVVVNEDQCRDTVFRQIIIYPSVTAAFQPLNTLECNPVEVSFINNSEYTGTADTTGLTYDWDFGDGSTSSLFEPTYLFAHTGDTMATFPVSLTVTNPYGCADTLVDPVQVHPFVEANFAISTGSGCSPLEVEINNSSSGGNYDWYWDDSAMVAPDQTTNINGTLSNTYHNTDGTIDTLQLTLVATNGVNCYDTMKRQVVVYPEVTADYTPRNALDCNPHEVAFDNLSAYSNTGDNSGLTWQWDFGDGLSTKDFEPVHTFIHTGDTTATFHTTLQAISPYSCRDTITQPVRVHPFIQADFEINQNKGCSPLDLTITNNSTGGITDYYWFWDNDNLALASADSTITDVSFTKTYYNNSEAPRIDTLTLIVTNGSCYDTLKRAVTVYSSITAGFAQDQVEGCNSLEVNFTNNTTHASSFSWEFGDGATSNQEDPDNIFENPVTRDTTFQVQFVATSPNGCSDTAWRDITVYSKLQADFEVAKDEGCPPFPVTFNNTSIGNTNDAYQWSVDGAGIGSAPTDASDFSHVFTNEDPTLREYGIELRAENNHGCVSTYRDTITVYHDVDSDFAMDRVEGCSPLQIDFSTSASVPAHTTYSWSFGDGATSSNSNPTHTFTNYDRVKDTSFTINLEVISPYNCAHDTSKTITVYHQPRARFDIDTTSSCPPLLTTMENQSVGHNSFEWRFGDGNINATDNVVQDYSYGGNNTNDVKSYNLELYVESDRGCADSTGLVLNVYPEVVADFDMDNAADCHPHPVVFTELSQNADFFQWDFDDGATSSQEDPIHRFVNVSGADTTYDVQLIASSAFNCVDTISRPVEVFAQPNAEFTVNPILQKWPEKEIFITNTSNRGPWDFTWDFGDGESEMNHTYKDFLNHDFNIWGHYTIGLEIQSRTSYCMDTVSKDIQVLPPRTYASFTMNDYDGCEPHEVQFSGGESPFVDQTNETYEYEWDFGDGNSGRGRFPTHVYDSAGVYYVSMKATGAGDDEDVATDTVVVYKVPEVDFDVDPKLVMLPDQTMHCYNFTNHATDYHWNFGDGSTSDKKNPEHVYEELGIYDIVLTATKEYPNDHVCRDSLRKEDLVNVEGKGFIEFPDAFTPSKSGPSEGYWNPEETNNDIFHPVGEGVVEYTLEIFNKWGERLFISEDFRIGWDGYFEGELMPQDVYIYKAEGKYSNGKTFEKMGNVTLLR